MIKPRIKHSTITTLIFLVLVSFVPQDFLTVAFDSGGVTTGPMTVPFIMALGIGFSAVRSDKHAENDSFGLVALCSVGPILAVLLLGLFYHPGGSGYEQTMLAKMNMIGYKIKSICASGIPNNIRSTAATRNIPTPVATAIISV